MTDTADETSGAGRSSARLPREVLPRRYVIDLDPNATSGALSGSVQIEVEVVHATSDIVLNAVDLEVVEASVEDAAGGRLSAAVSYRPADEQVVLSLAGPLALGPGRVSLTFRGRVGDKLVGLYRAEPEGASAPILVTQFEATHARSAFPCFDEPDMKAVWSLSVAADDDACVVSNSAELSREPLGSGRSRVTFADTIPMSSYLVALVVGPLTTTSAADTAGGTSGGGGAGEVPLRVVHPEGKEALTAFALESATFALRYLSDFYALPYPGDKLDLIAIPDFAFGAMENLGAVTFRERLLLVDPNAATQPELQAVADVIHHELAHMWFGDLVTMRWWNGIWLNEAFATYMEMRCTDAFRPEWNRWTSFGLSRTEAFDTDALSTTRSIEFPVESPEEAEAMFDVLTYEKGAAVVRMLEQYLGDATFTAGIRRYLSAHAYANTDTGDLWDALEEASGEPARQVMDSWIHQPGFPLVSVAVDDGPGDGSILRFDQQRFLLLPSAHETPALWSVPLLVDVETAGEVVRHRFILDGPRGELTLDEKPNRVLVNPGASGFYRTIYAPDLRSALLASLHELEPLDRFTLIDDTWAAVVAGQLDLAEAVDLLVALRDETDVSVWRRLAGVVRGVDRLAGTDPEARTATAAFARLMGVGQLARLDASESEPLSENDREVRALLFGLLGTVGADETVRERARALAESPPEDPSLAAAAAEVVALIGDDTDWEAFDRRRREASTPQEENRYLSVLADFARTDLLERTMQSCLDEIRSQDVAFVLRRALANREQGALAWRFVSSRFAELEGRIPSQHLPRMLEGVRWLVDEAAEIEAFVESTADLATQRTVLQHLERLRANVALRERARPHLSAALAPHL